MTEVERTALRLAGAGGEPIRAERFAPARPAGSGVVLAHDVFGLDAFARHAAERIACAGHVVLVPDLWSRVGAPGPVGDADDPAPEWPADLARRVAASMPDRRAVADLEAAVRALAEDPTVDPERIAAIGFGLGGKLALLLGCHSLRLAGVVDLLGRLRYAELGPDQPVQPLEMVLNLSAPLLAVYGARDASTPPTDVEELREKLLAFAKPADVVVEDAGDGFLNPYRSGWDAVAAARTWPRVLSFLSEATTDTSSRT